MFNKHTSFCFASCLALRMRVRHFSLTFRPLMRLCMAITCFSISCRCPCRTSWCQNLRKTFVSPTAWSLTRTFRRIASQLSCVGGTSAVAWKHMYLYLKDGIYSDLHTFFCKLSNYANIHERVFSNMNCLNQKTCFMIASHTRMEKAYVLVPLRWNFQ